MNKEQWTDEVLKSVEGIKRAKPSPDLFDKISAEIDSYETGFIKKKNVALIAMGVFLLVLLNLYAIMQYRANVAPVEKENIENENLQYALISDFKLYE